MSIPSALSPNIEKGKHFRAIFIIKKAIHLMRNKEKTKTGLFYEQKEDTISLIHTLYQTAQTSNRELREKRS